MILSLNYIEILKKPKHTLMINSSEFIRKIEKIDVSSYNQFNWFKVMYKMTEERSLHSRMIAFLLNPEGSHNQGTLFLKLFFEEFGILDFDLDQVKVYPEEDKKKEEDNIDILLTNANKQAIIIENKIFADDSNKDNLLEEENGKCSHKYQIPRYYYKMKCKGFTVTHIYYLTVKHNKPFFFDDFPLEVRQLVQFKDYIQSILNWIGKCLAIYPKDDVFKVGLQQYKQATTEFLNDMQLALKLKQITTDHLQEAFYFWPKDNIDESDPYYIIKCQFIHVKWHTVHEFYTLLKQNIEEIFNVTVSQIANLDITEGTHHKKKKSLIITFTYNENIYYVCNDVQGFSIGRHVNSIKEKDYKIILNQNYAFFNFKKNEVFQLIDPNETEKVVDEIVNALKNFINK